MYTNPCVDSGFYPSAAGQVLAEAHAPTQQPTGYRQYSLFLYVHVFVILIKS